LIRRKTYGPDNLASGNVYLGAGDVRSDVRLHTCLRQCLKGIDMGVLTWLTAVVTVLLLVYLFAALVRPEWF
jgi:K+-transporting ATPase KdpF subunit